jgi:hypothetical protein
MFAVNESDDFLIAVQAAQTMARHLRQDMVILKECRVVPLVTTDEKPLEIIRYSESRGAV